jgi:hypothetical protein
MSADQPLRKASLREWVTSILAFVVVGLWAVPVGRAALFSTPENVEAARSTSAMLGPVMGAVVGYYLGSRAGERQARRAGERLERIREIAREEFALTAEDYLTLRERVDNLERGTRHAGDPQDEEDDDEP